MDDRRFDALVRGLASGQSRRSFVRGLLGLGGATLAGLAAGGSTDAARRPTPTPKPVKCPGKQTWNGSACVCASGTACGPDCCTGSSVCCDNACCNGQCYGEELCCPTGQIVCNDQCCPANSQCCNVNGVAFCAPAGVTCCASTADCAGLDRCDDLVAHHYTCVASICTESVQNCQGADPCTTYSCAGGVCETAPISGCCRTAGECQAIDTCTPASCLDNHTCNAVSNCVTGEHCCSGTCASTDDRCCDGDSDCADLDFCSDFSPDAYHYTCVAHVCTRQQEDCLGDDPCVQYGCLDGTCTETSRCGAGEICCDDGSCSSGGECGCTIEGVTFPPCVTGCPSCVAPDGGQLCGCASVTGTACTSTAMCKDLLGDAICAGPPGSAVCVVPANPLV